MSELRRKIRNLMFHESYDIQYKLLNLILASAAVGGILSLIICILMREDKTGNAVIALLVAVVCLSMYLSMIKKKPHTAAVLIVCTANILLFPIIYIYCGGMNSGVPIWFVLGLIFSWLILKGKLCYILYVLNVLAMSVTVYISYLHPEIIRRMPLDTLVVDVIQSMIIVSSIFGVIFKYQTYVYEKQQKNLMEREEELKRTLEELKKANQAKSDFLAKMSHEIRTPINAVLGMDEMILRESENIEIAQYAKNIQSAGQTLLSLINDILDFSKIESGKMELLPVEYDVLKLIQDCYNMISMRAAEKQLKLYVNNAPDIPASLYGDEIRIRQIMINLLTNAVKYTPAGFVELAVDWKIQQEDWIDLRISVKDSGVGIAGEDQKLLFAPFHRIEEAKNRSIEGTGLGLTITKQLIDLMQGTIKVESEPGRGSVFFVSIPQKVRSWQRAGTFSSKRDSGQSSPAGCRESFRAPEAELLVVDDVDMNMEVVKGLLKNTGIRIDTALSGEEAWKLMSSKKYHLIFLDHMMPELDGVEVLHRMRQLEHVNKNTPVVVLTANAIIGAKEEYLSEGFSDYLPKPVQMAELEKMVLKYLPKELISWKKAPKTDAQTASGRTLEQVEGLDVRVGLSYCMDEEEFYRTMLKSYIKGEKTALLREYYQSENWEKYQIQVHAVKSTSASIGASKLSELARSLELAARNEDLTFLRQYHAVLLEQYQKLLGQLKEALTEQ